MGKLVYCPAFLSKATTVFGSDLSRAAPGAWECGHVCGHVEFGAQGISGISRSRLSFNKFSCWNCGVCSLCPCRCWSALQNAARSFGWRVCCSKFRWNRAQVGWCLGQSRAVYFWWFMSYHPLMVKLGWFTIALLSLLTIWIHINLQDNSASFTLGLSVCAVFDRIHDVFISIPSPVFFSRQAAKLWRMPAVGKHNLLWWNVSLWLALVTQWLESLGSTWWQAADKDGGGFSSSHVSSSESEPSDNQTIYFWYFWLFGVQVVVVVAGGGGGWRTWEVAEGRLKLIGEKCLFCETLPNLCQFLY